MKKVVFLFFWVLSFLFTVAQTNSPDSAWIREHYYKIERYIPMRDGIKLFTSIYIPKDSSVSHPILMKRTPYSCMPYGEQNFYPYWYSYQKNYLKEGYIMVSQDVRGRWMSEGQYVDVRPFNSNRKAKEIDEASDTYDAIDWLVQNVPHNNGRVGVFGISYPGFYSIMAAASNHPALKAVSPQAPVTNWFVGDDFHHNGAFFQMDAFDFYSALGFGFGQPHPGPTSVPARSVGFGVQDNYEFYIRNGTLPQLTKLTGDTIAFWTELMAHPGYDAWWQARDARRATKNLKPAMLWVGGNFDAEDNWGAWNAYRAAEENNPGKAFNKIVMGPWYHGQWASNNGTHLGNVQWGSNTSTWYQLNIEIPFFNYYLKGEGEAPKIAEATIFITGENQWHQFDQWPPMNAKAQKLYLQDGGKLGWNGSTSKNGFSQYTSDPNKPVPYTEDVHFERTREYMTDDQRFASRRPDVLVFETDTLSSDVTVTGNIVADLFTSISTTDADFVVKLIDVFPDYFTYPDGLVQHNPFTGEAYPMGGYEMLIHGEIFRGKFRKSFENPVPFTPNKVEEVKFKVADVAHTFKKGHRIMVQIQSSWFPLVDRNPQKFENIYQASANDFQKANIKIYHSSQYPSSIALPILKQ